MKRFDHDLEVLRTKMASMAELTQAMVVLSGERVVDRTRDVNEEIAADEELLDQLQIEIDREAVRMMTVYGPVAGDLRRLLVITHITAQFERIGDQVMNVIEALDMMQSAPEKTLPEELHQMTEVVVEMVDDAISSYFNDDSRAAEDTRLRDDVVDALNTQIVERLLSDEMLRGVLDGTTEIADAFAQILVARHLERIADQAVNVCKEVVYMVRGDDIRHNSTNVQDEPENGEE